MGRDRDLKAVWTPGAPGLIGGETRTRVGWEFLAHRTAPREDNLQDGLLVAQDVLGENPDRTGPQTRATATAVIRCIADTLCRLWIAKSETSGGGNVAMMSAQSFGRTINDNPRADNHSN